MVMNMDPTANEALAAFNRRPSRRPGSIQIHPNGVLARASSPQVFDAKRPSYVTLLGADDFPVSVQEDLVPPERIARLEDTSMINTDSPSIHGSTRTIVIQGCSGPTPTTESLSKESDGSQKTQSLATLFPSLVNDSEWTC